MLCHCCQNVLPRLLINPGFKQTHGATFLSFFFFRIFFILLFDVWLLNFIPLHLIKSQQLYFFSSQARFLDLTFVR